MRTAPFTLALTLALVACGAEPASSTRIAFDSDFAAFRTWTRTPLGDAPLAGHPAGARFAYVNRPRPAGTRTWPVGSILVKTIEIGATPAEWEIFAMVKRGGGYNPDGAREWEFFRLQINSQGIPIIRARGYNPTDGHGYMDMAGNEVGCNSCHGAAGTETTDHVLARQLQ